MSRSTSNGFMRADTGSNCGRRALLRTRLSLAVVLLVGLPAPAQQATPAPPAMVDHLQRVIDRLTDPALGGRRAGTEGNRAAADFIFEEFDSLGLDVRFQPLDAGRRNVVARFDPPPNAAGRLSENDHIVVGAHYDGQGAGMPGASDNAAGVAVMLRLARGLVANPLPIPVVFVAFDDEEQGLNGSRFYARYPALPLAGARAAVILDTMGRSFIDLEQWSLIAIGTERSHALARIVDARSTPETILLGTDLIGARSDFAPFAERRVPYVFFTNATHEDYHGPDDGPEQIRYDELARDAALIGGVLDDIGLLENAPVYLEEPVYPDDEAARLEMMMDLVEAERGSLPESYAVLFDDVRDRFAGEPSRVELRLATEILLVAATPRFAFFPLGFTIGPLYESEGRTEEALAAYREALRLAPDPATRLLMEAKVEALSGPR